MTFKLVRTDVTDAYKVELSSGTHLFGRGKFLDCGDKRVSRNHGELTVEEEIVTLKSLHQNPCFIMKKSTAETQILSKDNSIILSNGDRFGLLPDSFWYELLHCSFTDDKNTSENISSPSRELVEDNNIPNPNDQDLENNEQGTEVDEAQSNIENTENIDSNKTLSDDQVINFQHSNTDVEENLDESPSILPESTVVAETPSERNPLKRSHSSSSQFSSDESPSKVSVKDEPEDIKPSTSALNQSTPPAPSLNDTDDSSPQKPTPREPCWYGANCYRRNPEHKARFSHPGDPDWVDGPAQPCPFGQRCTRRNLRHWHLRHPPGERPQQGQKRRPKKIDDQNLDLPAKRVRKTTVQQDLSGSEFDSESEEDLFPSDGSDEWTPSKLNSDFDTQDSVPY